MNPLKSTLRKFKNLKRSQQLFLILVIALPLILIAVQIQTRFMSRAAEIPILEMENPSVSQNVQIGSDSGASGGKYLLLTTSDTAVTGNTYYVDCQSGNDTNSGTSQTSAWKTLAKATSATLASGDGLLLKRGCVWNETLTLAESGTSSSNIVVSAYGTGEMPTIQSNVNNARLFNITGDYITVENIYAKGIAPTLESGCDNNPKGYIIGFQIDSTANNITLKNNKASGNYAGVYIRTGSSNNKILSNTLENNTMMNPLDVGGGGDAGAFGVLVHGDDNEIAYNTINGHDACSYDYERDGGAVEIYGGSRNTIHHNIASQNDHFSELGKNSTQNSSDNVYAYNKFTSTLQDSVFINTRGVGHNYGPIYRTKVYNNSIYLTGSSSQGVVCSNCGSDILTLKNNILWANWKAIYASTSFVESNNIYWKTGGSPTIQGFTPSSTSKVSDPRYVGASTGDLHIQSTSPAVNSGSSESVTAGFTTDLDGKTVPVNGTVDIGAYEL